MPLPFETLKTPTQTVNIALEPAQNAVLSMMLLLKEEEMPGLPAWVSRTRSQLTDQEYQRHRLVIIGFYFATLPREMGWPSFPAYVDHLAGLQPKALREKLFQAYEAICRHKDPTCEADWSQILVSPDRYVEFLRRGFGEGQVEPDIEAEAYKYVIDPPAMQALIVDHLRWFWEKYLSSEWSRVQPMLAESARAFQSLDFSGRSRLEIARIITGQDLTGSDWKDMKWEEQLDGSEHVVFSPSPHIGPYINRCMGSPDTLIVTFGARLPEEADVRIPELDRADLVARLSALADDTRLHILQMIAERDEMRSQEIIDATHLSQPSVSRYLNQLTATGYLQERRINGSKAYSLNHARIEKTIKAISAFLLGR